MLKIVLISTIRTHIDLMKNRWYPKHDFDQGHECVGNRSDIVAIGSAGASPSLYSCALRFVWMIGVGWAVGLGSISLSSLHVQADEGSFNQTPSEDELVFFESKIRPLLIQHCYECHSASSSDIAGGLLLDSHAGIAKGGDSGQAILPGQPELSLLMSAVGYSKPELQMPPKSKLAPHEIADLATWIRSGAPDPRTEDPGVPAKPKRVIDWEKEIGFWSLKPIARPTPPNVENSHWPSNDIDRFVLQGIERNELIPCPDTDRATWLRRATYDLTGLPPTPEAIDQFVQDRGDDPYGKVVDRLLATREYGERWGRHWLDVVRYSDTAGDNSDFPIPQMVKYRDWVIDAMCRDMPYDQFVREQIAGDLIPSDSIEGRHQRIIATGYIAGARRFGSRVDDYPQHLTIEDTIDNLGRAFLATTVNCARCHDHKFDPVSTEDYYALYGFFRSTRYPWPGIELEQKQRDLVPLIDSSRAKELLQERAKRQTILDDEVKRLEGLQKEAPKEETKTGLDTQIKAAREQAEANAKGPLPFDTAYAIADSPTIQDAAVQIKGDPNKPGEMVPRHFLTMAGGQRLSDREPTSGRLQLADWIVDPKNPLTARVMVNRIWLSHFGRGIVPTPNDFGRQGKPPTHPELLDWLASRFIDSGWSIKALHREIMLSRTYRMHSSRTAESRQRDPNNDCLSSFPRHRLDAESIRDTLLTLSGGLRSGPSGVHPFPPQHEWKFTQHNPFKAVYDSKHRSVYLMTQRIQRHPYLAIFDGADPSVSTPARLVSTSPLQALYFLNDSFVHEQAVGFADRIVADASDDTARLQVAYRTALGRNPTTDETDAALRFLSEYQRMSVADGTDPTPARRSAWQGLVRSIFRLNEFVYID